MNLSLLGSGDMAGIPVHGCACALCRQARAVRHLRRRPTCLDVKEGGERLLVEAGNADLARNDWLETPAAVLLCSWAPPHWTGLVRLHLGRGPALPVFGPRNDECPTWLSRTPGQLTVQPVLEPGHETTVGRFQIRPFTITTSPGLLGYGIACGEQRLSYIPAAAALTAEDADRLAAWAPQAVVLGCPTQGHAEQRIAALHRLHDQLGRPTVLLCGIDHHLDQWLQRHGDALAPGIRVARDDQRLDMAYLNEYRRLGEAAG